MNGESLLIFLVIGALAGWLGGIVVRGYGLGLVGDIVVGVIGSFIGGWLFSHFRLAHGSGFIGNLIGATVGAIVLLFVLRLVRRTA
ncbi:MAG TPA: GlsB/YeaQ/YmgE family stress response membrane protein [Caulobacteraceae bacterium]|nr:GlsB/YeaQ/YmgE family stress response membrane protein [Caulobacteraceae bacterium]